MSTQNANGKYDRDFLLSQEKRNQLVELWEVEKYGHDCFSDPNPLPVLTVRKDGEREQTEYLAPLITSHRNAL